MGLRCCQATWAQLLVPSVEMAITGKASVRKAVSDDPWSKGIPRVATTRGSEKFFFRPPDRVAMMASVCLLVGVPMRRQAAYTRPLVGSTEIVSPWLSTLFLLLTRTASPRSSRSRSNR